MVNYGKPCNEPSEGLAVRHSVELQTAEPQFNYHCADEVSMARRPFRDRYLCLQQLRCLGLVGTVAAAALTRTKSHSAAATAARPGVPARIIH